MKKQFALLIFSLLLICCHTMAQKILLKIGSVTAGGGEEVKALEFKVEAVTSWGTGGVSVGAPKVNEILIKKFNNTSTNELSRKILTGTSFPTVILEYYDAANVMYFRITLKSVFVSNFFWLSPECPTCLKLEHQVAFVAKQFETFDVATGVTLGYDVATRQIY